jgi:hypothetical protein
MSMSVAFTGTPKTLAYEDVERRESDVEVKTLHTEIGFKTCEGV